MVVLSVTLISASPTVAYFHILYRETNTANAESSLVRVFLPQPSNIDNFSSLTSLDGVQRVIPAVYYPVKVVADGKTATQGVYFVSAADAPEAFRLFGLDQPNSLPKSNWLYFGYTDGSNVGIPVGKTIEVTATGIGSMVATTSSTTYSDSDFLIFGDIQAYWAVQGSAGLHQFNWLFVATANSSVADAVGETIAKAHPTWQVITPSQISNNIQSAVGPQLLFTLSLSTVSWVFGMFVFATYVAREVSTRSKELVTLGALGASKGELTRCVSYYLLILTSGGGILGLFLSVDVAMPASETLSYGYSLVESLSTVINTALVVLVPVLVLDVAIVGILRFRLGRLDMMSFLRAEV
jgi:ABC-type antimicrobial peptide transport system permease subunit